jgi:hypothetical protein
MCVVAIIPPKVNLCHISRGLLNNRGSKRHTASTAYGQHDSAHIETVGGIINITGKIPRKIFEASFLRNRAPGQRTTFFAVLLAKWAGTEVARCVQLAGDRGQPHPRDHKRLKRLSLQAINYLVRVGAAKLNQQIQAVEEWEQEHERLKEIAGDVVARQAEHGSWVVGRTRMHFPEIFEEKR